MGFANNSMLMFRSRNQPPPDNEIWYFAPEKVTLYSESGVKSHTFSGGKGVITYSSAVRTVPTTLRGTTVTDVRLPATVTSVAIHALSGCAGLVRVELPSGITTIGNMAFYMDPELALTELPASLTKMGNYAFYGCSKLALTSLPEGLTSITDGAFWGCSNLALTALPAGVTSIGASALRGCSNLALTALPAGVTSIGAYAFFKCTGLTSITFLGTPTTLDAKAFVDCTNLKDIYVPWAEGDIAGAPWGAGNATVHYTGSGSGGTISFPESFSVTDCSGNGAATGAYTKTANTTTVGGKDYPVYSMTQELLGTTFYIYVCGYQMGSAGTFWALKADSYSASDDSYGALGSCAAGTDGLPQSTSWSSASSDATVSWS